MSASMEAPGARANASTILKAEYSSSGLGARTVSRAHGAGYGAGAESVEGRGRSRGAQPRRKSAWRVERAFAACRGVAEPFPGQLAGPAPGCNG